MSNIEEIMRCQSEIAGAVAHQQQHGVDKSTLLWEMDWREELHAITAPRVPRQVCFSCEEITGTAVPVHQPKGE